jgi:tetratricopeptide (TPR) repeat protein
MAQRRISASQYLHRYDQELADRKKLLGHIPRLSSYNASLLTTWEISLEAVTNESENAAKLLLLCSFLHNTNISFELFRQFCDQDVTWLYKLANDQDSFEDEIEILLNFSFLQPNEGIDSGSYSVHPVVQDWGRDRLGQEAWLEAMYNSISVIGTAVPSNHSAEDWVRRQNLLSHAARCKEFLDKCSATETVTFPLLDRLGQLFFECNRLDEAKGMFLEASIAYGLSFGVKNHYTLHAMVGLAVVYNSQGNLLEAKETLQTVIDASKENENDGHSTMVAACLNLSSIYVREGNPSQARATLLLALDHLFGVSKDDQLGLYSFFVTLATVFRHEAQFGEAERLLYAETLLEQAKKGYESIFGAEDLSVYTCLQNLANVYWDQGRRSDARVAYHQALEGFEKILGPSHVSTYNISLKLCEILEEGDLDKAKSLCQEALKVHEKVLGPRHSSTLLCMSEMGIIYKEKQELGKAEEYALRAYQGFEEIYGSDNSETITLLTNLACVYGDQKQFAEAESLFQEALTRSERVAGPENLSALSILGNLAHLHEDLKMPEKAKRLYEQVLKGYAKSLGLYHMKTVELLGRFACFHASQGNYLEAKTRFEQALEGCLRIYGPNHARTLRTAAQQLFTSRNLDGLSDKILEGSTSDVQYLVFCGKPEPGGRVSEYRFVEKVPRFLCDNAPSGRTEEQQSATGRIITQIVLRHNTEILRSRNWSCAICGNPARELYHSALPFFVPGEGASAEFRPMILDNAIPICRSAGECDRKAEDMAHRIGKIGFPQFDTGFRICNQCGSEKNVKLCTGCRTIR